MQPPDPHPNRYCKTEIELHHIFLQHRQAFWCIGKLLSKWYLFNSHYVVSAPKNLMLLVLIYVEKGGGKTCCSNFFFPLMGFSKLLPKANNMGQILQTSLHIYSIFSIGGSFYLLSPLPLRSLNQQAPLLSLLLRVCISLSVSLYIHFSPGPQHHLVKTQNMIALSMNKVTRVHQIPKGILWPASSLQETQQSLPTKRPKHPVTEERLLKCNTLKSSKRFLFCINVKITCVIIEYLKSYKNILKTNPDSLPATAIKFSMKYIKTQRLFVKKKKEGRKGG